MSDSPKILAVPTNIVTGFLGVGKTTAILNLLKQKPENERWAVLVNEFGEIGVDGSLMQGQTGSNEIYVREVPGGCMCCAAGLPMQIALNQLLRRAKPHRLIIEPTGLGHPVEVLQALSADYYQDVLSLQKTVTLVDARNLSDERYTSHTTFAQQLEIADVIVGNKSDLYTNADGDALARYVDEHCRKGVELLVTEQGDIPVSCLKGAHSGQYEARSPHNSNEAPPLASDLPFPDSGVVTASNRGEGFESIGWRFSPEHVFDYTRLFSFISGLRVERMKAVFITGKGIFAYNLTRDALSEIELDDTIESRIEIIADSVQEDWESTLSNCIEA